VGVTPTDFILPSEGGYVVHEKHGLGRYVGKKKMKLAAEVKEYLVLQYDGGTFVYLPVEQIDKLNNYHGAPRRLDRI
jgi:transcription-repair coupling factor (superfamily II helicase)